MTRWLRRAGLGLAIIGLALYAVADRLGPACDPLEQGGAAGLTVLGIMLHFIGTFVEWRRAP